MLKVGDIVTRWLGGTVPMPLRVTKITENEIECELWRFDRRTGAEIDEYLDWGPPPKATGSFIEVDQ